MRSNVSCFMIISGGAHILIEAKAWSTNGSHSEEMIKIFPSHLDFIVDSLIREVRSLEKASSFKSKIASSREKENAAHKGTRRR